MNKKVFTLLNSIGGHNMCDQLCGKHLKQPNLTYFFSYKLSQLRADTDKIQYDQNSSFSTTGTASETEQKILNLKKANPKPVSPDTVGATSGFKGKDNHLVMARNFQLKSFQ